MKHKGLEIRRFETQAAFERWLEKNHALAEGLWVKFAKKGSSKTSLTYAQAREAAIIYGWIDGLKNRIDDDFYALRFTGRRAKSPWSKINRDIAEALIEQARMKPPGLAQVKAAQADGRWNPKAERP